MGGKSTKLGVKGPEFESICKMKALDSVINSFITAVAFIPSSPVLTSPVASHQSKDNKQQERKHTCSDMTQAKNRIRPHA